MIKSKLFKRYDLKSMLTVNNKSENKSNIVANI